MKSMLKMGILSTVLTVGFAGLALAHHNSPMDPDIGDAMGMHEAAIEDKWDTGSYNENSDDRRNLESGTAEGGVDQDAGGNRGGGGRAE